jgi:putative transposase
MPVNSAKSGTDHVFLDLATTADPFDMSRARYQGSRLAWCDQLHTESIMPRRARLVLADIPLHIIQRGNNRHRCFFTEADYPVYLAMLHACATSAGCQIHAYVLMTNHVHLLVSPGRAVAPGEMMKGLGQRYVQYVNRRYGRTGTLWEGRFRSCLVECARYLLTCQRYIELNPVRAKIVSHPAHYQWSSYRANAHGEASQLITPHLIYTELGHRPAAREAAYRQLFRDALPTKTLNKVRRATNGNFALGHKHFTDEMSKALGRAVVPQQAGRPSKK